MNSFSNSIKLVEKVTDRHAKRIGQIIMALVLLYLWTPVFVLTLMSFSSQGVFAFPPQSLSFQWYSKFLNNQGAIRAIFTSLQIALPVTVITTSISLLLAYATDRYEFPGKSYVQTLATLPLVVPLVIGGVALVLFFGVVNIQAGYWTTFIAHVVRTIPFGSLILISTFSSFDQTLEEASKDLGANELKTFAKITIPNILPGIIASGLLVFTMSFNEFVYTFFVKSSTISTLPTYIWSRIRFGISPEVNVISVMFIFVAGVLVLIAASLTQVEDIF